MVLFADTFNRYFEADNLRAAVRVLRRAGYDVFAPSPARGELRRTPSNESIRSSASGDDYASLQYMLGDEGGVG